MGSGKGVEGKAGKFKAGRVQVKVTGQGAKCRYSSIGGKM